MSDAQPKKWVSMVAYPKTDTMDALLVTLTEDRELWMYSIRACRWQQIRQPNADELNRQEAQ